jgi:regulator of replication initiation timing
MYTFSMRTKILSFLLLSILVIPTGSAQAGQLQDNIEGITRKLVSTLQENASLLEILADLELSADIAADDKDIDELKRIKDLVTELIDKLKVVEKELPPLKKSLDEDCVEARKDKSETADAIDTIGACEDAESVYVAAVNSSKSFKESQKNIEVNLAKFGLTLIKPTPTPSQSIQPTPTPTPFQSSQPAAVTSKKPAPPKKTTIVCVKGNLTKKVTAVKPKCPTGYKLKK